MYYFIKIKKGWGGHYYDEKTLNCVWDRLASHSYSIFFPMSSIVVPCISILFCYMRIFFYANGAKTKVIPKHAVSMASSSKSNASTIITSSTNVLDHNSLSRSIRIAKGLFASFMLFTLCWLPYGIIVMSDYRDKLPRTAHMFSMTVAHLNSALNPVLYGVFNPAFRRGYKLMFDLIFLGRLHNRRISTQISTAKTGPS